jgi:tyrosyl-tRNA synthetase
MPILPGIDGTEKMSKSLGNHIAITDPPEEMYGRTLSIPDGLIGPWFELLAVEGVPGQTGAGQEVTARDLKRALARGIVARFHGPDAALAAEAHFDRLFVERQAPEEIEEVVVQPAANGGGTIHLPALIAEAFGRSRSEARRLVEQGGVKLDGLPVGADELDVAAERLDGAVLQVGKRRFRRLRRA